MLYSCPNHELLREIIIQNFYARLSRNDQSMLDTSCTGSFMKKTIEFRWDLLERIKRNSEYWKLDEGKSQRLVGIGIAGISITKRLNSPAWFLTSSFFAPQPPPSRPLIYTC